MSMKLTLAAWMRTSTSPAPGDGVNNSSSRITSGPPYAWIRIAFMGLSPSLRATLTKLRICLTLLNCQAKMLSYPPAHESRSTSRRSHRSPRTGQDRAGRLDRAQDRLRTQCSGPRSLLALQEQAGAPGRNGHHCFCGFRSRARLAARGPFVVCVGLGISARSSPDAPALPRRCPHVQRALLDRQFALRTHGSRAAEIHGVWVLV